MGIKGIVVNLNGLYGVYDVNVGHLITPCVYSRIFSRTRAGVTTYYLEYDGQEMDLKEYLEINGLLSENTAEENKGGEEVQQQENPQEEVIEENMQ